jgi:L-xylulokinase
MLLGLDIGVSVVKASLFSEDGASCVASLPHPVQSSLPDWMEKDAEVLWKACCTVIRDALAKLDSPQVDALGICACGNGCVLLDSDGQVLRPIIFSNDTRAADLARSATNAPQRARIFAKTRQALYPGQTAVLLQWIRDHEPSVYSRIHRILLVKDFIRWKLTGVPLSDFSDIGATGLMNLENKSYDSELLSDQGLQDIAWALPELRHGMEIGGYVTQVAAEATGLRAGLPVAVGCIDCEAALIGTNAASPGDLSVIAGSWSINQARVPGLPEDADIFLTTWGAEPGTYTTLEGSPTSAINFDWFVRTFQASGREVVAADYKTVIEEASALGPEENVPIFLPYLHGAPVSPSLRGAFLQIRPEHTKAHIARAALEGVVFGHLWHVEKLIKSGLHFERVRLAGGASRSPFWTQLFADILGLPVSVQSVTEVGALGAALCAGVAIKRWPDLGSAAAEMVQEQQCFKPDPERHRIYAAKYRVFKNTVETLSNTFDHASSATKH